MSIAMTYTITFESCALLSEEKNLSVLMSARLMIDLTQRKNTSPDGQLGSGKMMRYH
jgi:hypothetical protein